MNSTKIVAGLVVVMSVSLGAMDLQREACRAVSDLTVALARVIDCGDGASLRELAQYSEWFAQEQKNEAAVAALKFGAPVAALSWIKAGANVGEGREMLLGCAVRADDDEAVKALCAQGANKEDALMLAVSSGKPHLVKVLVERGANVYTGHSIWAANAPLHLAQQHAHDVPGCAAIVRYLKDFYRVLRNGKPVPYSH